MRSDEVRDDERIGSSNHPDGGWEIWREARWPWDPDGKKPWVIYRFDVRYEDVPDDGYFATWREAMDFVCEYELVKDWAQGPHDYEAMAMALDPR